jgi:hypothetical protein
MSAATTSTARRLATCAMAMVLVATLLWGGCLSCSQYYMLGRTAARHCCMPTGECKNAPARQSAKQCNLQVMALVHQQSVLDHATNIVALPVALISLALPDFAAPVFVVPVSHAPPPNIGRPLSVLRI